MNLVFLLAAYDKEPFKNNVTGVDGLNGVNGTQN